MNSKALTWLVFASPKTHDGQTVYPAGLPVFSGAHGWTQCDNSGASYATWIAPGDQAAYAADLASVRLEAATLRTRKQCIAALEWLAIPRLAGETCREMRLRYENTRMRDLWPLRAVK